MRHFRQDEWVDFVRGLVRTNQEKAMRDHLQDCESCGQTESLWRRVRQAAGREADYAPPVSAIRVAKAFWGTGPHASSGSLTDRVAKLVWDSWQQPLPVGVRTHTASPRQMLYRAGDYLIDLRVDRKEAVGHGFLVGQVMNASKMGHRVSQIPIVLEDGSEHAISTMTNAFGEFQVEFKDGRDFRLSVGLHKEGEVVISLGSLESEPNQAVRNTSSQGYRG